MRNVYSLYVRVKVKKYHRISELDVLEKDIQRLFKDLHDLFQLTVDTSSDRRSPEASFTFQGKVTSTSANQKEKKGRRGVLDEGDDDDDEDAGNDSEGEHESRFVFDEETTEEIWATLGGNQTRTHKCHMLTYIPQHFVDYGSFLIGTTRHFENLHRLVKAWTAWSNRAKLGAVEGQVLMRSFTSRLDSAPKAVKSIRARLFREQNSSGVCSSPLSDDEEDERDVLEPSTLLHSHSGTLRCV